jgi:hypothetical protein
VKRLALRAHRFACAGVPLAFLHEARLRGAVKRPALALTAWLSQDCAAAVLTAKQVINTAKIVRSSISSFIFCQLLGRACEHGTNMFTRDNLGRLSKMA